MIEIPRAALTADQIASGLTSSALRYQRLNSDDIHSFSRDDDAGKFLNAYYDAKILRTIHLQNWIRLALVNMDMAIKLGKQLTRTFIGIWRARWRSKLRRVLRQHRT